MVLPLAALLLAHAAWAAPRAGNNQRRGGAGDDPTGTVYARLEKDHAIVGESVRLFVTFPRFCRNSEPRLSLLDFTLASEPRTVFANAFTRTYVLKPKRTGRLEIPPISYHCGDWSRKTFRLTLEVAPGFQPLPPSGGGGGWAGRVPPLPLAPADPRDVELERLRRENRRLRERPQDAGTVSLLRPPPAVPASEGLGFHRLGNAALAAPAPPAPPAPRSPSALTVAIACVGGALLAIGLGIFFSQLYSAPPPAAAAPARAPSTTTIGAGKYELGPLIGQGGMGEVYRASDRTLGRNVAIKKMRAELKGLPRERERFLQEAHAVAKLSHPNIITLFDVVTEGDEIYIVFDYVDGRPLSAVLDERGRLPLKECRAVFKQVCQALDYAHRQKILHRDLKPSNIMLTAEGHAKVMDFGIAREAKDTLTRMTQTQTIVGTPTHMAPEQHLGSAGRSTDVYALGVCLYEMLTGALPFHGPDFLAQKERRRYAPPTQLDPGLPKEADVLVSAMLEPDPKKRVADPLEFLTALEALPG